jgi:Glycosyltransferase WbsX
VTRARPAFTGHYQPHLPADLGFYDLRVPEVREAQARLAAEFGIHGFCYYYYWFEGLRLLERPFEEVLHSGSPDFPFCLCWANESWTRRWDGSERAVLLEQHHSDEDDIRFIQSLLPAFHDRRYIRVNGKPLLLIYHSQLLPNAVQSTATWRDQARSAGFPDLYLVRAETHTIYGNHPNAAALGFDGAMEFPPHAILSKTLIPADPRWPAHPESCIFDYREVVLHSLRRPTPDYKLFRGVMPSWDNSPRRANGGAFIFAHSSPELYQQWLCECARWTQQQHNGEEQLVFINAWNEWGEGCHLEPDQRYGHRYLEATRNALMAAARPPGGDSDPDVIGAHRRNGSVAGATAQILQEKLALQLQLRDRTIHSQGLNISSPLAAATRPTFHQLMAQKLSAEHPRLRRTRKAGYQFLRALWRAWKATRMRLRMHY